jgi:hypothetical protein
MAISTWKQKPLLGMMVDEYGAQGIEIFNQVGTKRLVCANCHAMSKWKRKKLKRGVVGGN